MSDDHFWNLCDLDRGGEYHNLSLDELRELLKEVWQHEFKAIGIGRDAESVGQLMIFSGAEQAFLMYENFDDERGGRFSFDFAALNRQDSEDYVRLSPEDAEDYSFRRCQLISKRQAWEVVTQYLDSGNLDALFSVDNLGMPVLGAGEPGQRP